LAFINSKRSVATANPAKKDFLESRANLANSFFIGALL
jgi:hypothetical protein